MQLKIESERSYEVWWQITKEKRMENRDINKRLMAIYDTFGEESQMSKIYEESNEFLNAFDSGIKKGVIEVLADLYCHATQFYLKNKQMQKIVETKIARTEQRILSGYYERQD